MYVLDTNILVAALWSRLGASFQLLRRVVTGRLSIAVSVALALEYEEVLNRASIAKAAWATADERDAILDAVLANARRIMPIRTSLRPALSDPSDDMVLECAVQAGADAIVTMNVRDFREACELYRVDLLRPWELLRRLKGEEG